MSDSTAENVQTNTVTPGVSHWAPLVMLDRTGLPSWQIGLSAFLGLALFTLISLVVVRAPNPNLYPISVAFVAIVVYFLVLYLEMARGWHQDLLDLFEFDERLFNVEAVLEPRRQTRWLEIGLAILCAVINTLISEQIEVAFNFLYAVALGLYILQYLFMIFCLDVLFRQLLCLQEVCGRIRISLLEADHYAVLANPMLRFLRLYIFGLCIIFTSYTVFTSGELAFSAMLLVMMPFYLPGLVILALFMLPYNLFKRRIHIAKTLELNHVHRALVKGDKAHLASTLIGEDIDKLSRVDLLYYEERIARIKELPFTDRIRSMLLFGVLPPLTWVIAALIEIYIESSL